MNNENNDIDIDIERLRSDLMDMYGAAVPFIPAMMMEVIDIESSSDEEIIKEAIKNKIDLSKYDINKTKKR